MLLTMGITMEYGHHYASNDTYWIANQQNGHSTKERISTCSYKENCHRETFINMFWLYAYHIIQKHWAYPNYDAIPNI